MRGSRGIDINGEALRKAIDDRDITLSEIANRLGLTDQSTFSKYIRRNRIQQSIIEGLEEYFGIPFSEYAPEEEEVIMRGSKGVPINGAKLKMAIAKRGITLTEISERLGLSRGNSFHNYIRRNRIQKDAATSLEEYFGIPFSEYSPDEEEEAIEMEKKPEKKLIRNSTRIDIDGMKFRQLLIERELSAAYVSRELGYCDNQVSSVCNEDKISKPMLKALELRFGITYEDIKIDEPEPEPEPVEEKREDDISEESNPVSIDMDKLYETIFSATYKAMKKALSESVNELTIIQQNKLDEKRKERRTYRSMHPEMFGDKPEYDIKEGY